jgi:hypothetical protein
MEWNLLIPEGNGLVNPAEGRGTAVALVTGDGWDYWQGGLK